MQCGVELEKSNAAHDCYAGLMPLKAVNAKRSGVPQEVVHAHAQQIEYQAEVIPEIERL